MNFIKYISICTVCLFSITNLSAQKQVAFVQNEKEQKIDVMIDGKFFTSYLYSNKIDKPVLFPLITATGTTVTRGFPLATRANERTDHPHHIGMWFNYGDVNGLDFWNNSDAIKAEEKSKYGSIRHEKIVAVKPGKRNGELEVSSNWVDFNGKILLKETTILQFSGDDNIRTIDRTTTLTAQNEKVTFKDNKEGVLGIRVARELEMPSQKAEIFTDAQGLATKVAVLNNEGVTGNFLSSEGITGNDVWGTRGNWCTVYGQKNGKDIAISIIDHPKNPGYPTYWHARGYGLFAANTLGQEVLSGGKEKLDFSLDAGKSVIFKYRVLVTDSYTPSKETLNISAESFAKKS